MIFGLAMLSIEDRMGRGVSAIGVVVPLVVVWPWRVVVSDLARIWSSLVFLDPVVVSLLDSFLVPRRLYRLLKL